MEQMERRPERALLVSVDTGEFDVESSLSELYELIRSAGADPVGSVVQKRPHVEAGTCVGTGMLREIAAHCEREEIDLLVFDRELTPTQIRNIEEVTGVRVIDRTQLILDIFALRARSREGRLQVELAQLKYLMPRLTGRGVAMSRLGGGIGTRGPGESKLETDRRHIRRRIESLREQLDDVEKHRALLQKRRKKDGVITAALVGYTNAGKSTLMNRLTQAGVLAENKLFATLDPTARALTLPGGSTIMLIDTVGLVRRLPHQLVDAFRSTLEEAANADVILNVCDASSPEAAVHLEVTRQLLEELGCSEDKVIPVMNQCDKVPEIHALPMIGRGVRISALTGEGIDTLLQKIEDALPAGPRRMELFLPYREGELLSRLHERGQIEREEYGGDGIAVTAVVPADLQDLCKMYEKE